MKRKWEYRVDSTPTLPPGATSALMNSQDYEWWLNTMDEQGWEFVGYMQKRWNDHMLTQQFWTFRRLLKK